MNKINVLIIGGDSAIGQELSNLLLLKGENVWQTTRNHQQIKDHTFFLNLFEDESSWLFPEVMFDIVFICAAINSFTSCEEDPYLARKINVLNTVKLAALLHKKGAFIIFLSSSAVLDGSNPFADETVKVNPKTKYGIFKAEAEHLLMEFKNMVALVRLSKVITPSFKLFNDWVKDLESGKIIYPFFDMSISPVSIRYAVYVLYEIAKRKISGTIHVSASDDISYASVAKYIAGKIGVNLDLVQPCSYRGRGITYSPLYTTLDCSKLWKLGIYSPNSKLAIDEYLNVASEI